MNTNQEVMMVASSHSDGGEYDYGKVAPENRAALQELAREIQEDISEIMAARIRIGERLIRARSLLPHGEWTPWLLAETGKSETWSRECMDLHKRFFGQPETFSELDAALQPTALVRLSTAPEAAFADVVDRVRQGEQMRVVDVEDVIRQYPREDTQRKANVSSHEAAHYDGESDLREMGHRAHDDLVFGIIQRTYDVLNELQNAENQKKPSRKDLEAGIRERCRWLTDALEQLTQCRARSETKPVHTTFLARSDYDPSPWADAAGFLRDYSTSQGWEKVKAADLPDLIDRGVRVLGKILM